MEKPDCIICNSSNNKKLFRKESREGEAFTLVKCSSCGLQFINPRPDEEEIRKYYDIQYFTRRTERGYNNYFSPELQQEIERVIKLNLADLQFFSYEAECGGTGRSLDIGCAAGYFVQYMKKRGWQSKGIDVSSDCVAFAREQSLDIVQGNYLDTTFAEPFDIISLWATIEHLHRPDFFLEKIHSELKPGGRLYLTTCRAGFSFMHFFGSNWRFYNFPEHLYYFSYTTMKRLLHNHGFSIEHFKTYGSGIGKGGSLLRKSADFAAKNFFLGDMMLLSAVKTKP